MKILVVDDDPSTLLVTLIALQDAGDFEVEVATGGIEAVERARKGAHDAILLDSVMQDLDGIYVLRELRSDKRTDEVPVIFHTAKTDPSDVRKLLSLGALGVIRKPFDPTKLAEEIKWILRNRGHGGEDREFQERHRRALGGAA